MTCRKIASILGQVRSYLVALPFLRLVTQKLLAFSQISTTQGWDHSIQIPKELKHEIQELRKFLEPGLGQTIQSTRKKNFAQRQFNLGLGGIGHHPGCIHSRILEEEPHFTHKSKRVDGCSLNNSQFCEKWGNSTTKCPEV